MFNIRCSSSLPSAPQRGNINLDPGYTVAPRAASDGGGKKQYEE
ncbi:MAG: hypothetical protein ACK2UL_07995 [Anaerolineae bacterium]